MEFRRLPVSTFVYGTGYFLVLSLTNLAMSQTWPIKPIVMIVPYAAGGPGDILARAIIPEISQHLGHPVIIDLKPGAGGNIGAEVVAKTARPDGYTILWTSISIATNPVLQRKFPFDPFKDLTPVAAVSIVPTCVVVNLAVPVNTLAELITYAKKKPGGITYGSAGPGTASHLGGVLFTAITGIEALHVPFKGIAPAQTALLGGQLDVMFDFTSSAAAQVKSGRLRALAVASDKRQTVMADIPTAGELGFPAYDFGGWFGIFAPAQTPRDVIKRLNTAVNFALGAPSSKKRLTDLGTQTMPGTSDDFGHFYQGEVDRWRKLLAEGRLENID